MSSLADPSDIWVLKPNEQDLITGASYASITLPWTFNRMMMNTSAAGQKSRALNIAKGIVGQEMLRRALSDRGVSPQIQDKSHRADDLFDFRFTINGETKRLDVKSVNYYTNYAAVGREPLSPTLVVNNADYPGPDWRRFFPMLVPHTQIGQEKQAYCFAIASSIDFRDDIDTNRTSHLITAFPYGGSLGFMCSKRLCLERESAGQGFYLDCTYHTQSMFGAEGFNLTILGEWDGNPKKEIVHILPGQAASKIGPFSCVSSFQVDRSDWDTLYGQIEVIVCANEFKIPVLNSSRKNINVEPLDQLILTRSDFCNLILPTDYTLYVIGWILKEDFLKKCRDYSGWVWPMDRVDRYMNQTWSQITDSDRTSITRAGFSDCIQDRPRLLKAGWLKTNGRGGGACCYVFPNIGSQGGVKETNLYVLPKDLRTPTDLVI